MKNLFKKIEGGLYPLVASMTLLYGCQNHDVESQSVTELVEKIETKYDGGEKIETKYYGGEKIVGTVASDQIVETIKKRMDSEYQKRISSAKIADLFSGYDVGVIPDVNACPTWSQKIDINMDDEDDSNTSATSGYTASWTSDGNSHLHFCRVDGRMFNPNQGTYTVLGLGNNRPSGFETTSRILIDNEDHRNANSHSGDLGTAIEDGNTFVYLYTGGDIINFTVVPQYPNFGFSYAVFAQNIWPNQPTGWLRSEDESDNNINELSTISGVNRINPMWTGGIPGNGTLFAYRLSDGVQSSKVQHETYFYISKMK
ncbi:hypothetical protein [Dyadobacter sp. CY356]|uniref:hypothetical protein n=1 Tax=Dyadobacter sp. CY356 TaxID=2906442 RepID=UPI001F332680|nr:hypothetical protein [Dyadobacter sp. CY356]MCF0054903.1 hypothetical protein [Dyadobacter sp. CY356]